MKVFPIAIKILLSLFPFGLVPIFFFIKIFKSDGIPFSSFTTNYGAAYWLILIAIFCLLASVASAGQVIFINAKKERENYTNPKNHEQEKSFLKFYFSKIMDRNEYQSIIFNIASVFLIIISIFTAYFSMKADYMTDNNSSILDIPKIVFSKTDTFNKSFENKKDAFKVLISDAVCLGVCSKYSGDDNKPYLFPPKKGNVDVELLPLHIKSYFAVFSAVAVPIILTFILSAWRFIIAIGDWFLRRQS